MKYAQPVKRTTEEILNSLKKTDMSPLDRINIVISAVFHGDTVEFSGDVLIKEFSEAGYKEKIYLRDIFETYYQMCKTTYRIDESISLLENYKKNHPESALEIDSTIEDLKEYKVIFGES